MGTSAKQFLRYKAMRDRVALLEALLMDIWRWTTFDGQNVEALRGLLKRADADAEVRMALDALVKDERD